jgi:hypothetical protein
MVNNAKSILIYLELLNHYWVIVKNQEKFPAIIRIYKKKHVSQLVKTIGRL